MFHAAQGIAHIVHIFAHQEGLLGVVFQISAHLRWRRVHPAFHIGDAVKAGAMEGALVMHHTAGVAGAEETGHCLDAGSGIGLVAARPK